MINLSVNINKITVLRNSRGGDIPDVLEAARTVIKAGCHGITVHPRPDARGDVLDLAQMPRVEFNIEGYPNSEFLDLVCQVHPTQCTLVPDPPDALTSNAGWILYPAVATGYARRSPGCATTGFEAVSSWNREPSATSTGARP